LVGKTDFDIASQDLADAYRADDRAILDSGKSKIVEEWIENNGERRWSETFKSPVTLDGRVIGTVGFARDVTERKNAEAVLRESEEQFRTLTALAPVGIYLTDAHGQCIYVNSSWCEMAGMNPHEALGDGWKNALHAEDRDKVLANWERMVASRGKWGTEYRFQTPEGKTTWVYARASPLSDAAGEVVKYLGINMDITERKQMEQK
jgi:PAS domain S-box-containing protein